MTIEPADTQETRQAAVRRYLAAVPLMEQLISDTLQQMAMLGPEQRERVREALVARGELMERIVADALVRHLTTREIDALAVFYASTEGRSLMKKFPLAMAEMLEALRPTMATAHQGCADRVGERIAGSPARARTRRGHTQKEDEPMALAPNLADIAAHPELLDTLPPPVIAAVCVEASALIARGAARIAAARMPVSGASQPAGLIDLATAAARLCMSPATLRRQARIHPALRALTVDNGTDRLVFDPARIAKFIERRNRSNGL